MKIVRLSSKVRHLSPEVVVLSEVAEHPVASIAILCSSSTRKLLKSYSASKSMIPPLLSRGKFCGVPIRTDNSVPHGSILVDPAGTRLDWWADE